MKQFTQSNPKAHTFAACACFACAGLVAALGISSALFVLALVVSLIVLGLIRLVRTNPTFAC